MKFTELDEDERAELLGEIGLLGAVCAYRAWNRTHELPSVAYFQMTDEDERDFNDILRAYCVEFDPELKRTFWAGAHLEPDAEERSGEERH